MKGTAKHSDLRVSSLPVGLWLCLIPTKRMKKPRITSFIFDLLKIGKNTQPPLNLNKYKTFNETGKYYESF